MSDETDIEVVTVEAVDEVTIELVAVEQIHDASPTVGMLTGETDDGTTLIVASAT